jgi:uncharacterized protein (DUF1697 family)
MADRVYIALLRGINVTGRNKIAMKDLRTLVATSGAEDVETYLQSGNVVFRSSTSDPARVGRAIQSRIQSQLGLEVVVLVRTAEDFRRAMEANPLVSDSRERTYLHLTFLAEPPDSERAATLREAADAHAPDLFRLGTREIYLYCPGGYGRTKLNNAFFERKLAVAATTRNWRTVTALADLAGR